MRYDVIVAGGGIAGVSAALAARRAGGGKVLLIERQYLLGGLATGGLVTKYLPLCDGDRQVSFGLAEELLRLSIRHGAEGSVPDAWLNGGTDEARRKQRFRVDFNPYAFAIDMEQLLLQEGVEILYGAFVCGTETENGRLSSIEVAHKSGKETLTARAFVDATGDADLFYMAGAPTANCGTGNTLAAWYYGTADGKYRLHVLGFRDDPDAQPTQQSADEKQYKGLDARGLSGMMIDAHRTLYADFLKRGELKDGHALTAVPTTPQVRMTRRILGLQTPDEINPYTDIPDSIGLVADWRRRGKAYALPLGALKSPALSNTFAAGRCISVTDALWDITRVIPACAVTGQAAGVAAAVCGEDGLVDVAAVQEELKRQGVKLGFK